MIFSYYFDTEKKHRLNCSFNILQFAEKADGFIEIMFTAEIEEIRNGNRLKKESALSTFLFPPTPEGQVKHDVDFTRVRYSDEQKWIFTVINNKDNTQKAVTGLISSTANKNPLGMDIYHNNKEFETELKANNLSILEQGYVPPVLIQTLASTQFQQAGYPERFGSASGSYDHVYQNYKLKDFIQGFLEPIPAGAPFKIQMDLAPIEVNPTSNNPIFYLEIPDLGRISLLTSGLEYAVKDALPLDVVRTFFEAPVEAQDFWNNSMTSKAKMTIEGDGKGELTIRYFGTTTKGIYNHALPYSKVIFNGLLTRLDNIAITYQK